VFVAETAAGVRVTVTGSGASGVCDLHGSAEYRAAMIPVIAERAVAAAG
jgi:CO/xanthine dehydrogenase FAD-binding subunit